jgi:hypothetical protein
LILAQHKSLATFFNIQISGLPDRSLMEIETNLTNGYSSSLDIVSRGWLASIAGATGAEVPLEEYQPLKSDSGLKEAKELVECIRSSLSTYWTCF